MSDERGERPTWTQADAEFFRAFLVTGTGRKVAELISFDESTQNRHAVTNPHGNHSYLAGFAAGFSARGASLMQLSANVRPQQDNDNGDGDGVDRPGERLAP